MGIRRLCRIRGWPGGPTKRAKLASTARVVREIDAVLAVFTPESNW
jgi:hypothetical protein